MEKFWNNRYSDTTMAYGEEPNEFFKSQLLKLEKGRILLPAEGEGRNAVYSATLGWEAYAFDISEEGKKKADVFAEKNNVSIDYKVGGFNEVIYKKESFDCIGLISAHFLAHLKPGYHKILDTYLRKGGIVILEGFSKSHLAISSKNPKAGGPKNIDMLFSIDEINQDFRNFEIIELSEQEVNLSEGLYHNGKSSVIKFVGRKK